MSKKDNQAKDQVVNEPVVAEDTFAKPADTAEVARKEDPAVVQDPVFAVDEPEVVATPLGEVIKTDDTDKDEKPTYEYVTVDGFTIEEDHDAFVQVLGPQDTYDLRTQPAGFVGVVKSVSGKGFETETAKYVELKPR